MTPCGSRHASGASGASGQGTTIKGPKPVFNVRGRCLVVASSAAIGPETMNRVPTAAVSSSGSRKITGLRYSLTKKTHHKKTDADGEEKNTLLTTKLQNFKP